MLVGMYAFAVEDDLGRVFRDPTMLCSPTLTLFSLL